jgi:transketolase
MRTRFIQTLTELAREDSRIWLVVADLGFSVVEEFEKEFPERFVNTGIAEANAVSIAGGLALSGKIPYVYSIAPFVSMRAFEQVRLDCAYMNNRVRLVGVGGGVAYGAAGATHHAIEDLALMRALPNMTVLAPGDPVEVEQLVRQSIGLAGPAYIRLNKNNEPVVTPQAVCRIGRANVYAAEGALHLLTTGNMFEPGMALREILLREYGLEASLANLHTVKPLDEDYVRSLIATGGAIFTLEEHNRCGGLGSAVAEVLAEAGAGVLFRRFAIPDAYSHYVGSQDYIRRQWQLDPESVARQIAALMPGRASS